MKKSYVIYFDGNEYSHKYIVNTHKDLCYYPAKYLPIHDGQLEYCQGFDYKTHEEKFFWAWSYVENYMNVVRILKLLKQEDLYNNVVVTCEDEDSNIVWEKKM